VVQRQDHILLVTTPLIIIGLAYIATHDPVLAILVSAFTVALVFNMVAKTMGAAPMVVSIATGAALIIANKASWLSLLLLAAIMAGMLYPILLQRRAHEDDYLYAGTGIFLICLALLSALRYATNGQSPFIALHALMTDMLDHIEQVLKESAASGTSPGQQQLLEHWPQYRSSLLYYLPGTALALWMVVTYSVIRMVRRRMKGASVNVPVFSFMRIKERYLFILIFGIVMEIVGRLENQEVLLYVSRTILLVTGVTYFLVGLSLVTYLFLIKQTASLLAMVLKVAFLIVIIFQPYLLALLGLLDVWFDFRKLSKPARSNVA
jgi:hypothetical protein